MIRFTCRNCGDAYPPVVINNFPDPPSSKPRLAPLREPRWWEPSDWNKRSAARKVTFFGLLAAAVVLVALGIGCNKQKGGAGGPDGKQHENSTWVVQSPDGVWVIVAVSKARLLQYLALMYAEKYPQGKGEMWEAGLVFTIQGDTKVDVTYHGPGQSEIRILEGPHEGETVWVSSEFLKKKSE